MILIYSSHSLRILYSLMMSKPTHKNFKTLQRWYDIYIGFDRKIPRLKALLSLSRKRFQQPDQLIGWAKNDYFRQDAPRIIELMNKGRERGQIPFPDLRKKKNKDWSPEDEKLFNVLRQWRNEESERRGVDPSRVLSNRQLKKVARKRPASSESLASVEGLEAWKVEEFGEKLVELVGQA